MVADNAMSITQGHCSNQVWIRAIHADDRPVGFLMLYVGPNWSDGIDCPRVYLWCLMIAHDEQGKGYRKAAMYKLINHLRSLGVPELLTSYQIGEGRPEGFYRKLGIKPTGDHYGEVLEVKLIMG